MSSILEALKKLEAEKNAQLAPVEEPDLLYESDYTATSLLGNVSYASPRQQRIAPLTLVLAGGIFTMLTVGMSVLLAVLLIQRGQPAAPVASQPPGNQVAAATAVLPEQPADPVEESTPSAPPVEPPTEVVTRVEATWTPEPAPKKPAPRTEYTTPVPVEVRYEPYVPKPESEPSTSSVPLPDDIRKLPMLSRTERDLYQLEGLDLNMLNEANSFRPTGNAIVNLEKVFVGETLPGTNAKLLDVRSHGIAIEVMSTRQRYYLPRT